MNAIFSIFPKFFRKLSAEEMAEMVHAVGLDTVNLVIRDGFWCKPDSLATDVPAFVKTMEQADIKVHFATAGYMPQDVLADDTPLRVLADNGVREFRLGYYRKAGEPGEVLDRARGEMTQLADLCDQLDVKAVYQVHHGTDIPSPSAIWHVVNGLPGEHIGVMLDPGNQANEGFERWSRAASLLGDNLAAIGVKDAEVTQDASRIDEESKGWSTDWTTLDRGVTNWYELVRSLDAVDFDGTFVWMPFYNEGEPEIMKEKLAGEVKYLRKVVEDVTATRKEA
jgi:sugar phosphate isomerase/epimerase